MPVTVNGREISEATIAAEEAHHADNPSPREAAACALAIRELLLQRAREAGLVSGDAPEEAACEVAIERLLDREAPVPEPTQAECRRFYEQNLERYTAGELAEVSHILFAVTPAAPLQAIRGQAEATLEQALAAPERFSELAQGFSNCPSAAQGGNLGQIQRGATVPEFERAVFGGATGILPRLVNTRYGFHIVRVDRIIPGRLLDFETVQPQIARTLSERVRAKADEQYVRLLAASASITGVDLGAATSPLVR